MFADPAPAPAPAGPPRRLPYPGALLLLVAALLLLPGIGRFGLWDPQEISKVEAASDVAGAAWMTVPERHARPPLPLLLLAAGIRAFGTSEVAARLPVALCALATLGALYLLGRRLFGWRAALLGAGVLLTVPTFFLGARQATLHLVPVLGHILATLGLAAAFLPGPASRAGRAAALLLGLLGLAIGFFSLGAALGVAAPLCAVALAVALGGDPEWVWAGDPVGAQGSGPAPQPERSSGLGWAAMLLGGLGALALLLPLRLCLAVAQVASAPRLALGLGLAAAGGLWLVLGRRRARAEDAPEEAQAGGSLPGTLLLVVGLGLCVPLPPMPHGYSPWIGGFLRWPPSRDVQIDSVLKPLGFQLFPWSGLLPLALCALLSRTPAAPQGRERGLLLLPLCWFVVTYLLATYQAALSQEVPFPALGALALAAGLYLDRALDGEGDGRWAGDPRGAQGSGPAPQPERSLGPGWAGDPVGAQGSGPAPQPERSLGPGWAAGAVAGLLCVLVGRDLYLYPEQYGSAHVTDTLKWPAPLAWVSPVLVNLSVLFGGTLCLGLGLAGRCRRVALAATFALALAAAGFGAHVLTPLLSKHVSYRGIFMRYKQLGGSALGLYAVPRSGSKFYDKSSVDLVSVAQVFEFLHKDPQKRAFVLIGAGELAAVDQHARQRGLPYYVVDDSNVQFLLLSSQLPPGEQDRNPLRRLVLSTEPRPQQVVRATFEDKLELLGYDLPPELHRGQDATVRVYFKVLKPLGGDYKIFLHIEGGGNRINGDHSPLDGKFPTTYWVPGTYVIDEHHLSLSRMGQPAGLYQVLTGLWPGGAGARLRVTSGPQDGDNRVKLGAVRVK